MRKTKRWRIRADDLPSHFQRQNHCLRQSLPDDVGTGHSNIFQLEPDLTCIETRYTVTRDLAVLSQIESQEPRLIVTLGLQGQSRFTGNLGDEIDFREGFTTITAFNSSLGERQYETDMPVTQLRLSMSKAWIDRYFGESKAGHLFRKGGIRVASLQPISPQGIIAAQQLLTSSVAGELGLVFRHGQALSLLASELCPLFEDDDQRSARFDYKDKTIANRARDILFDEFRTPPSVEALSRRVGTNQFRLKQLFRHFFNDTPYGVLLAIRMDKAYQLLKSSRCHVSVAADYVGYRHASNFSAAFIKHFGVSPKTIAKN
ncbi:MAG: AraC family transcriptional regulator [Methylococcaceae bacterium]|nr:AraC family transcriptional regulator [Methylococcaceae bacterium]